MTSNVVSTLAFPMPEEQSEPYEGSSENGEHNRNSNCSF
jgi:hypothetical protein